MGLEPVAEEEEEAIHFEAIYFDLTNLLKRSVKPEASAVSSLLLDPQVYHKPIRPIVLNDRSIPSLQSVSEVNASIYYSTPSLLQSALSLLLNPQVYYSQRTSLSSPSC